MEKRDIQTKTISQLRDARKIFDDDFLEKIGDSEEIDLKKNGLMEVIRYLTNLPRSTAMYFSQLSWEETLDAILFGLDQINKGNFSKAFNYLNEIQNYNWLVDYIFRDLRFLEGIALIEEGKFEEARTTLLDCRKEFEDSPDFHYLLGIINYELGAFSEAIDRYAMAIKIDPGNMEAVYRCGIAYLKIDQPEVAMKDLHSCEQSRKQTEFNSKQNET